MRREERHDPVARVLVDRALEAMHAVGEDREEAIEDRVPRFRIELLGQLRFRRDLDRRGRLSHRCRFQIGQLLLQVNPRLPQDVMLVGPRHQVGGELLCAEGGNRHDGDAASAQRCLASAVESADSSRVNGRTSNSATPSAAMRRRFSASG